MTEISPTDRANLIYSRFKRSRLDASARSFWETWTRENCSLLIGMFLVVVNLFLEPALLFEDWPPAELSFMPSNYVSLLLLLLLPANGWFLDRFLSSKTPGEASLSRWILILRFLGASLPLFNLYMIALWKSFLERRPSRPLAAPVQILDLSRTRIRLPAGLSVRPLYRSGFFFAWQATGFLPLLVWATWLTKERPFSSHRETVILAVCAILHLATCAFMLQYIRFLLRTSRTRGWRRFFLQISPFLCLLAIPGSMAGLILIASIESPRNLSSNAYDRRSGASRIPLWQGLQGVLRQGWQRMPWFMQWRRPTGLVLPDSAGRVDAEIAAFFRLRTLLLALEGAIFFEMISALAVHSPRARPALSSGFRWTMYLILAMAALGLFTQATSLIARLLRISALTDLLSRHPYGRFLLLTQVAFLAGIYGAFLLGNGQVMNFGVLLGLGGTLCVLSALFFFLPKVNLLDGLPWLLLFFLLAALGIPVVVDPEAAKQSLAVFETLIALTPLWTLGLFLISGRWLLRPFSWRHVFDRGLPLRFRAALAFVILTAVLPLGGLAIPFWIYARHRIWPRYERMLPA